MAVVGGSLDQMLGSQSLSNLLGQDKMTPALFRPPAPKATPVQQAQERLTGVEQKIGETQQELGQFEATQREFAARQRAGQAGEAARLVGEERQAIEGSQAYKDLEQINREAAQARFEPSQRNAQENAALFSLIGAIGFAIGAGGKKNAMQAMAAMNGMVEGVRKGDMERYNREKSTFETNLKALNQKSQTLASEVKRITELAARDKEQARLEFESLQATEGADFVKQYASKFGLPATLKYLEQQAKGAERMLQMSQQAEQREQARVQAEQDRQERARERMAFEREMAREREAGRVATQEAITQRMREQESLRQVRADERAKSTANKTADKPPAKEIVQANTLRNNLIPKIEDALPILDRLNKEGKWNKLTVALAFDPRAAEAVFKDDPEALNLILTLAYFRSKEFETAGKALTRKEDQILAPIVRGDLRVYEATRNAMVTGLDTLRKEQKGLEAAYPWLKTYNQAFRGEVTQDTVVQPEPKPMPTGDKLNAYADTHFQGNKEEAKKYLSSQGYK